MHDAIVFSDWKHAAAAPTNSAKCDERERDGVVKLAGCRSPFAIFTHWKVTVFIARSACIRKCPKFRLSTTSRAHIIQYKSLHSVKPNQINCHILKLFVALPFWHVFLHLVSNRGDRKASFPFGSTVFRNILPERSWESRNLLVTAWYTQCTRIDN